MQTKALKTNKGENRDCDGIQELTQNKSKESVELWRRAIDVLQRFEEYNIDRLVQNDISLYNKVLNILCKSQQFSRAMQIFRMLQEEMYN